MASEGRIIDNYELREELGRGGMAIVHRAHDLRLRRDVAFKVLHEHIAANEENRRRFEREALTVARLKHPHIVQVYACSSHEAEVAWIATELVEGCTARTFVEERGGFPLPTFAACAALAITDALAHAHEAGVIHRDIKPENIMFNAEGVPKLMDFGLARVLDEHGLTRTGSLLGSPAHMSPESIEGRGFDARSDVFALGTLLYYLVSGALPFSGTNPASILNAILRGTYAPIQGRSALVDDTLAGIIDHCLRRRPEERYPDARAVHAALEGYLREEEIERPLEQLRAHFSDPGASEARMRAHLISLNEGRAEEALREGRTAILARACDRLLALDPSHEGAEVWLQRLRNRRRRERMTFAIGLLAVLLIMTAGLTAWLLQQRDERAHAEAMEAARTAVVEAQRGALRSIRGGVPDPRVLALLSAAVEARNEALHREAREASVDAAREGVHGVHERARLASEEAAATLPPLRERRPDRREPIAVEPPGPEELLPEVEPPTPEVETGELLLRIWPLTAVVLINDEPAGVAEGLRNRALTLPAGTHLITARLPELNTEVRRSVLVQSGRRTEVALDVPWRPATLRVQSTLDATVFVDGRRVGRSREPIEIAIEGRRPERDVRVEVFPDGEFGQPYETSLRLRTAQEQVVEVPF